MQNRQVRRKEQTKQKIYKAALQLFLEKGYDQTTVDQITEAADVAKGTFFNYFPTKESILSYFAEQRFVLIRESLAPHIEEQMNTQEKLKTIFSVLAKINVQEEKAITYLIVRESTRISFIKQSPNSKVYEQIKQIFLEIILEGQEKRQISYTLNPELVADLCVSLFFSILVRWLENDKVRMEKEYLQGLEIILKGISSMNTQEIFQNNTKEYDVVIVGGGLAGLSAAAYLADKGKKVLVLERGKLGGRAVTLTVKGFNFNFGAHAIYGRDTSYLQKLEKELNLTINWRDFEPTKAKYDIGTDLTDVPANIQGLFRTKLLKGADKVRFTFEILKTLTRMEKGNPRVSIKSWLENKGVSEDVKDMMLTLAGSNFFTSEPELIPSDVYFTYYQRLFSTSKPVSYIGGGWQAIIDEFVRVIENNHGEIRIKNKVVEVITEENQIRGVKTTEDTFYAKDFIFCIPPKELNKIFVETKIEPILKQYATYEPTYVFVYDLGLAKRIDVPYTYIYDKQHKIFITDISYYDEHCVPEGGQLLQAIAYLKKGEQAEDIEAKIEDLYDKHFEGWRDVLVVPRISKRASVQEIKWNMFQQAMPNYFPEYRNLFFAGDWCVGTGQLSELSFSSSYTVSQLILGN